MLVFMYESFKLSATYLRNISLGCHECKKSNVSFICFCVHLSV